MRCTNCNKTISQKDKYCRFCGELVVPPEPPPPPESGRFVLPIQASDFGPGELLAAIDAPAGSGWGAHIYTGGHKLPYQIKAHPDGAPEWLTKEDWTRWYHRGLVVWSHTSTAIGAILASEALELLAGLHANRGWESEGIPIVERHETYKTPRAPRRSKKKGAEPEPTPAPTPPKPEKVIVETERVRLLGNAATGFYAYLQANEATLQRLVLEEKERHEELQRVMGPKIFKFLVALHRDKELREYDPTKRSAAWRRQEFPLAFICDMPPDRGTITSGTEDIWWRPVIERPNHLKHEGQIFLELKEAMDWVEKKIPELRAQEAERAQQQAAQEAEARARWSSLKKDLTAYWIDPVTLEPERITYRVIIEVDLEPYQSSKMEISFGKFWHSDKKFHLPDVVARQLRFDPQTVNVEQISRLIGTYFAFSKVTYFESHLAAAQAQQIWDHSAVADRFHEGKVRRARYGFEEIETEYCVWLGKLEDPQEAWPWRPQETRTEYMSKWAMRETLW